MVNHGNRSRTNRDSTAGAYIVMDAPGHYGAYAEIHSTHDTLTEAMSAAGKLRGRAIVSHTEFPEHNCPGQMIPRDFALRYPVLWSLDGQIASDQKARRDAEFLRREKELHARYTRGSNQYFAARDALLTELGID